MTPQQHVRSGDVELAVYTWGKQGKKPVLVLVHGYPDSASVWKACAEKLSKNYFVVAYDVRGAGRSSKPTRVADYDLDFLVKDLSAVVDVVSPKQPVHLLCHDWGSIQSWEAVTTERMKGRIASYTSISGPSLDHAGHWLRKRITSGSPAKIAQAARQFAHSWYVIMFQIPVLAPTVWKMGLDKRWPAILKKVEGLDAEANETQGLDGRHGVKLYRANFAKRVFMPRVRRTNLPVQLIVPTQDKFMVREIWDDLAQWAPNVWRRDIKAGHWLPLSHPELLAEWVGEFVDFIEGGAEPVVLQEARMRSAA